ncbi:hypothetical protein HPB50_016433 [Hyalomma asiaticum]|uniref:Uncharacterized protein n=1 Tax=Hyalomma asiaticum TaxID=266040 RepID=A0ACB7T8I6_HYAAI|nr:hypothetical protein HPB50_016433 [Hyalomma asiaticum]
MACTTADKPPFFMLQVLLSFPAYGVTQCDTVIGYLPAEGCRLWQQASAPHETEAAGAPPTVGRHPIFRPSPWSSTSTTETTINERQQASHFSGHGCGMAFTTADKPPFIPASGA